jgi:hypothetical protein
MTRAIGEGLEKSTMDYSVEVEAKPNINGANTGIAPPIEQPHSVEVEAKPNINGANTGLAPIEQFQQDPILVEHGLKEERRDLYQDNEHGFKELECNKLNYEI